MCGRFAVWFEQNDLDEIEQIVKDIDEKIKDGLATGYKTGEVYPTDRSLVISTVRGKPSLGVMKWGFPKWDGKGVIINARCESAKEKSMFSKPLYEKRCVIPSSGFFEWNKSSEDKAKRKDKYLFTSNRSSNLYMAGIYNVFKNNDGVTECYTILTRDANEYMVDIHNRMPVMLYEDEIGSWLDSKEFIDYAFRRDDVVLDRELCSDEAADQLSLF